jgi:hypothetical protein
VALETGIGEALATDNFLLKGDVTARQLDYLHHAGRSSTTLTSSPA